MLNISMLAQGQVTTTDSGGAGCLETAKSTLNLHVSQFSAIPRISKGMHTKVGVSSQPRYQKLGQPTTACRHAAPSRSNCIIAMNSR